MNVIKVINIIISVMNVLNAVNVITNNVIGDLERRSAV